MDCLSMQTTNLIWRRQRANLHAQLDQCSTSFRRHASLSMDLPDVWPSHIWCRLRSLLNIRESDRDAARVTALAFSQHAVLNILNLIDARQCTIFMISRPSLDTSLVLPVCFCFGAARRHDGGGLSRSGALLTILPSGGLASHNTLRCRPSFWTARTPLLVRSQICGTALVASLASYT